MYLYKKKTFLKHFKETVKNKLIIAIIINL